MKVAVRMLLFWRGGLPGTESGIRERCVCLELCLVATWSVARLMRLELARSDRVLSRVLVIAYSLKPK